ncbi:hypothetical protein BACCAP_00522 [Pseudoflavonifractor capillosus ATCC 29799]|uniref:Uncharacterized protein n=1 Tax=Pseudoflavonifractor capillosus ATCC 29799 TaxID=411467 RepID=A6NQQ2_9FIRM|nr:hypothetical protein BACCAP_00522 [Pseudoflavonifractor capillosus ATCC 29799]
MLCPPQCDFWLYYSCVLSLRQLYAGIFSLQMRHIATWIVSCPCLTV